MEPFFRISEKKICLYGYIETLEQTDRLRRSIESSGQSVIYIIDKKANLLNDSKVITLEKFIELADIKDEWAFVLCLWDAKTQEHIAEQLFLNGFNNIVFCPLLDIYNKSMASEMRWIYNNIRYGNTLKEVIIPKYNFMIDRDINDYIRSFGYKENDGFCEGWIELWIPMELIHTSIMSDTKGMKFDTHISEFEPYNIMYEYVMGKRKKYPNEYLHNILCGRNENDFLENRRLLFEEFSRKLINDSNYFVESPIEAKWNDKGYFNLVDGHHRTVFLYQNGYEKIPLIITGEDYKKFRDWQTDKK